jgi:alkylation response protein AidB-like acyl-CoA dehydrogenase
VIELGKTKITAGPVADLHDRPTAQTCVARRSAAVIAARARVHESATRIWEKAVVGNTASIDDLADTWAASSYANEVARDTVDMMYAAGGTSSLYVDSPLERAHRDIHAMRRRVIAQPTWFEQVGRVRFGLAPTEMLFGI